MLNDLQRHLEIGSHRERLDAVKALGDMDTREAMDLLQIATEDIDPQIRETAEQFRRNSIWFSGSSAPSVSEPQESEPDQESLF